MHQAEQASLWIAVLLLYDGLQVIARIMCCNAQGCLQRVVLHHVWDVPAALCRCSYRLLNACVMFTYHSVDTFVCASRHQTACAVHCRSLQKSRQLSQMAQVAPDQELVQVLFCPAITPPASSPEARCQKKLLLGMSSWQHAVHIKKCI